MGWTQWRAWWQAWRLGSPAMAVRRSSPDTVAPMLLNHADWQGRATLLLVDHHACEREFLAEVLTLKGYVVLQAGNGSEAWRRHVHHRGAIDVLLTGLAMPAMNGAQLVTRLRPERPLMRVVWLPSGPLEAEACAGLLQTGDAWLPKPFTVRTLLELLRADQRSAS
jgi:two-component system cell cycle sensor histidine kinase/response regulator CckA